MRRPVHLSEPHVDLYLWKRSGLGVSDLRDFVRRPVHLSDIMRPKSVSKKKGNKNKKKDKSGGEKEYQSMNRLLSLSIVRQRV